MKKMLLEFIEKTGKESEFNLFVNLFRSIPREKFAVIKISGKVLENQIDMISNDIAFLNRSGIYPIIVHGAGSALDKRLPLSKKILGMRMVSGQDMPVVKEVCDKISSELKEKIIHKNGNVEIARHVFAVEPAAGCVGSITDVNLDNINMILAEGKSPIISPLGIKGKACYNINADTAAKELVKAIKPKKLIFLTETGGILDREGKVIPFINLQDDDLSGLTGGMLLKAMEIKEFLSKGIETAVVVTSAENLIKELFTIKGSGTYLRFHHIISAKNIKQLDKTKIKKLLEEAFNKTLDSDYFEAEFKEIFLEKNYDGIALIKEINNIPYLDKFAVAKHSQGNGLGRSPWLKLMKKYPKLTWRATPENPINEFYAKNCDGFIRNKEWKAYWKNLDIAEIMTTMDLVLKKEKTIR